MTLVNMQQPLGQTVEERLADLEAQIASSWALKTRTEYETEVRERLKSDLLAYTMKVAFSAAIVLGGAGYLFLKSATLDVYQGQNKQIIADLKARYDNNLAKEQKQFEWKRDHDYGKSYTYLAEFYALSNQLNENKKKVLSKLDDKTKSEIDDQDRLTREEIKKAFEHAYTYFSYALRDDPLQGSTYWELGQLYYTYPTKYGPPNELKDPKDPRAGFKKTWLENIWLDPVKALYYYQQAVKYYSPMEIARGWRADSYRQIGTVFLAEAKDKQGPAHDEQVRQARTYLEKSLEDYRRAIPESADYNEVDMKKVEALLLEIMKVSPEAVGR